ncbi:hypothetical protein Scep_017748 [Stephania cephalantha]|uniref:Uncharacterized protein n=1 Tax=Stephania cephalantha TaxID=152367 RepID=A0AAP0IR14_9MAGN
MLTYVTTPNRCHITLVMSHVARPYPTYVIGLSSSHYTSSSPPRSSSSRHATPSPSAHPAHSLRVGDEHTSTFSRPPTPHRTSSARSSTNRLRSSIPPAIKEIPDFFKPPTAPREGENPLIHLIVEHGLYVTPFFRVAAGKMSLVFKSGYSKEGWKWCSSLGTCKCHLRYMKRGVGRQPSGTRAIYLIAKKRIAPIYLTDEELEHYKRKRTTDEAFKKKSEQMSTNRKSEVGEPGTDISLHSAGSISARQHGDTLEKKLKRRPTRMEMFRHLHTHGHDGQTFVDQISAKIDAELTRRLEEMSTQSPDTSIDKDVVYLEVVTCLRIRVTRLSSQHIFRGSKLISRTSVCAALAFGIGVAYREGVASLFLLNTRGGKSCPDPFVRFCPDPF